MQKKLNNSVASGAHSHCIGIDLMGCDTAPEAIVELLFSTLEDLDPSCHLVLLGTAQALSKFPLPTSSISARLTEGVISMEDDPLFSVRRKKDSSLCVGMKMLQNKELDALISAGNTGALITSARLTLDQLPNIERPALLTLLPTKLKPVAVLDVGANVSAKAHHLLQFASMGIGFQKSCGIEQPKVGLLNIGSEAKKGTPELREAYQKLQILNELGCNSPVFIGNVEGRDVFHGLVDVLVTDGFSGNIFLKTAEGIASFILGLIEQASEEAITSLHKQLSYAEYPGALLCGVEGIVMKCHGDGHPSAFRESIKTASRLIKHNFLSRIKQSNYFNY